MRLKNSFKTLPSDGNSCRTFLISTPPSSAFMYSRTCEIYGNFIALDILRNVQQKGCDIILLQICVFVRVVIAVANESIKGCVTFPNCWSHTICPQYQNKDFVILSMLKI